MDADSSLSLFLYDMRENTGQRQGGRVVERDIRRRAAAVGRPPVWMDFHYAVSAQAADPSTEHTLLAAALTAFLRSPELDLVALLPADTEWGAAVRQLRDPRPFPLQSGRTRNAARPRPLLAGAGEAAPAACSRWW